MILFILLLQTFVVIQCKPLQVYEIEPNAAHIFTQLLSRDKLDNYNHRTYNQEASLASMVYLIIEKISNIEHAIFYINLILVMLIIIILMIFSIILILYQNMTNVSRAKPLNYSWLQLVIFYNFF